LAAAKLGKDAAPTRHKSMHKIRMIRARPAANCGAGGIFSVRHHKTPGRLGTAIEGRQIVPRRKDQDLNRSNLDRDPPLMRSSSG
jgi:hypothetical protein